MTTPTRSVQIRSAISRVATVSWQGLLILLAAGVLFYVLGLMWTAILPIVLALLLSTLLWPIARFLRAHRWPPALAAAVVTLVFLAVIGGVITLIIIPVALQAPKVADGVVSGLKTVQTWVKGPPLNLGADQVGTLIDDALGKLQNSAGDLAGTVLGGVSAIGDGLITAALVLIVLFFMLKDGPRFLPWLASQTGPKAGVHTTELLSRGYSTIASFMRSQALVGLLDALFIGIGLLIVGVPLVLPLALLTFIGAFIPIIGAFVAGAFAVLIALVSNGLTQALIVLAIIVVVQQLEGNVFAPMLQGKSQNLHPAVIILAVIAGSSLAGIIGALLAVPVVALIALMWRYSQEQLVPVTPVAETPDPPEDE